MPASDDRGLQSRVFDRLRAFRHPRRVAFETWIFVGQLFGRQRDLANLRFCHDGVWIQDVEGAFWLRTPEVQAYGLDQGVQWELAEVAALAGIVGDGLLIDVGAGIGSFSVAIPRRCENAQVLACEAAPRTASVLRRNLEKNGVSARVEVVECAIADIDGVGFLAVNQNGMDHLTSEESSNAIQVRLQTLDALVDQRNSPTVSAIKIDVEGVEFEVLQGAVQVITRDRPALLIEIEEEWASRRGRSATEVFEFLADLGYTYERFDGLALLPGVLPATDLTRSHNFLFRHQESAC